MTDFCLECGTFIGHGDCPGCVAVACLEASIEDLADDELNEPVCGHCGKAFYDFSDLGCGYCDRRSPEFGLMP